MKIQSDLALPIPYFAHRVHKQGLRLKLVVEDRIVCELKPIEKFQDVYKKQILTYLRLPEKPLGLLIDFFV